MWGSFDADTVDGNDYVSWGNSKDKPISYHRTICFMLSVSVWAVEYKHQKGHVMCKGRYREDVSGSPAVRPALSAALSSFTVHTNVHISTAELFLSCRPYVCNRTHRLVFRAWKRHRLERAYCNVLLPEFQTRMIHCPVFQVEVWSCANTNAFCNVSKIPNATLVMHTIQKCGLCDWLISHRWDLFTSVGRSNPPGKWAVWAVNAEGYS